MKSKQQMMLRFLEGSKRWFALSILFGTLRAICAMVNPRIVQYTVDYIIGAQEQTGRLGELVSAFGGREFLRSNLWLIALVVIVLATLASLFRYGFILCNTKGGEGFVRSMRDQTFSHIQRLPFSWHMMNQTGDIIQRCTVDIEIVKSFLSDQFISLLNCIITIVTALIYMFSVNIKLTLIIMLTQGIMLAYSAYFSGKIGELFQNCDEMEGELSNIAQENLTGVRVVRAFGREEYEQERFDRQSKRNTDAWIKLGVYMAAFWEANALLIGTQALITLAIGTVMVVHGEMSTGSLLAMISYTSLSAIPVRQLGRTISEMSKAGVSVTRLYDIMSARPESDKPNALTPEMSGDIVFEHVNFHYPNCPVLLKDINLTIPAGTTLGILGSTGSGKSTLVHLLNRLYDLPKEDGRITIGRVDIADMKADWVRSNVGMVLQEPMLFSRTLSENIAMGAEKATLTDIREAAKIACLDEAVQSFAKGYDTMVGERGVTLSGGQKQRTAIARMLLQKTPIMVFDDSLSAVDAETDSKIRAALKTEMAGATCILISHRISTLMEADKIMVLDGGKITELGTHEELVQGNGLYRQIYDLQLKCAEEAEQDGE